MASSSSGPQLLINAGELGEILRTIKVAKDLELKIVGNLFGLWKNSCDQPVVQLVTGPGKRATVSKKTYSPDGVYHIGMKKYLEAQHGLLQIGLWCSGNSRRYPSRKYIIRNFLFYFCSFRRASQMSTESLLLDMYRQCSTQPLVFTQAQPAMWH